MHFSSTLFVPYSLPIVSSLICSHQQYLVRSTNMQLIITQLSPVSCYFLPLKPKYLPQHLSLFCSLNVSNQVSHPYKTGKITVMYISIFTCLDTELPREKILDLMAASICQIQSAYNFLILCSWFLVSLPNI